MDEKSRNSSSSASPLLVFDDSDEIDELILGMISPEEMQSLQREAVSFVGDALMMQQDVGKHANYLLSQVSRDRDEALQALRATTGEQLSSVRRGMDFLTKAERSMHDLAAGFEEMNTLVSKMQSQESYNQIKNVHFYHENLSNIIHWTSCLDEFDPTLDSAKFNNNNNMNNMSSGGGGMGNINDNSFSSKNTLSALDGETAHSNSRRLEEKLSKDNNNAKDFLEVYSLLRTMQSIRARLAVPTVVSHHGVSISYIRHHLREGERILDVFVQKCFELFRRAPEICTEYILSEKSLKSKQDREMLFAAIKVANQESKEPALYCDLEIASNHLNLMLLRMAENNTQRDSGGYSSASSTSRSHHSTFSAASSSSSSSPVLLVTSLLSWEEIQKHLDYGASSFFFDYICVDRFAEEPEKQQRMHMRLEDIIAEVPATCEAIEAQMDPLTECIDQAMMASSSSSSSSTGGGGVDGAVAAPLGPIQIVPYFMKRLHFELCDLILSKYCDQNSGIAINDLQRVLELTVTYRETCLERGTIGQYVAPAAMEEVATSVLEVAVSGMRDYLATNARNCVIRVIDKDVKQQQDGTFGTTGPGDLLFIVTSMLKSVTKGASADVRSQMSHACATALRYYVDRFCDKLSFEFFPTWYTDIAEKAGITHVSIGDRWALWICTAVNDFLELQRNVGKLDASLFDLHHQVVSSSSTNVSNSNVTSSSSTENNVAENTENKSSSSTTNKTSSSSSVSPLQTFASILGSQVLIKLISHICDYLELKALEEQFNDAFAPLTFMTDKSMLSKSEAKPKDPLGRSPMQVLVDEVRSYSISIQASIQAPCWNAVASRNIVFRMMQLYLQRLLAAIQASDFSSKVNRIHQSTRIIEDMRLWTALVADVGTLNVDQLRYEDRNNYQIVPDLQGGLAALRILHSFCLVDSVERFKKILEEDCIFFRRDIPEYIFDIMFDANKAASNSATEISSSLKSSMKKLWKEFLGNKIFSNSSPSRTKNSRDEQNADDELLTLTSTSSQQQQQQQQHHHHNAPSIFAGLDKDRIIPKSKGFFSRSKIDDAPKIIGYRFGFVNICYEPVVIRDLTSSLPKFGKKYEEVKTVTLAQLLAMDADKDNDEEGGNKEDKKDDDDEKGTEEGERMSDT